MFDLIPNLAPVIFAQALFALGIEDLLKAIVPLIFLVIWVVSQVMGNKNAAPQPKPRPQPPGPEPEPPEKDLREEIEVFLRRAAGEEAKPPPREPPAQRPQRPEPVTNLEIIEDVEVAESPSIGRSVREHVSQHINTRDIEQQTSRLGQEVGLADEKLESHLHDVFDHRVGSLQSSIRPATESDDAESALEIPSDAAKIAGLLAHPDGMRQAIILNEILTRPDDRW